MKTGGMIALEMRGGRGKVKDDGELQLQQLEGR